MKSGEIYQFTEEDAYKFANYMGIQTKRIGKELSFLKCPFCRGGKHSDKGTFSISLIDGRCECKRSSCGYKGNMITLAKDTGFELSDRVTKYLNLNHQNDGYKKFKDAHRKIESKSAAIKYLESRGISEAVCKEYEITTYNDKDNILVFPFKDDKGELQSIKYRKTDFNPEKDKNKEWFEKNCKSIIFGMNHSDPDNGPLIITEGQIDSLSLAEAGLLNAVSVPNGCRGFTWIPFCWDWLQSFKELIVFGDCENGHITLVDELNRVFNGNTLVVQMDDYKGCKDANEILQKYGKEALKQAVNNAQPIPNAKIVEMADIKDIDLDNLESIKTLIPEIDELLSGGLHMGELILLTGKRGDGKSTFMSELIVNALRQQYKSFVYSGELSNSFFKAWIDKQIIGRWNIYKSEHERINEWYRHKLFIYDSSVITEDETDDLLPIIEDAIIKYGCRLICIDNLMTAMSSVSSDSLYHKQSKFVGQLKQMAQKFNVAIILVAHPRKSQYEFQNDDVSGSADITNKVDIVMSYARITDQNDVNFFDESARRLLVTKNRLTGKLTSKQKPLYLFYSDKNKRIVGADKNFDFDTGWQGEEAVVITEVVEDNPFEEGVLDAEGN